MFGMGGTELLVVFVVILLVFGPSQIPKMARGLGQAMREFRKAQREITDEIQREEPAKPASTPAQVVPKAPENKPVQ